MSYAVDTNATQTMGDRELSSSANFNSVSGEFVVNATSSKQIYLYGFVAVLATIGFIIYTKNKRK